MDNLTEKQTRELKIDKALEKTGWRKEYIKEEVNSIKSNFNTKEYVLFSGNVEKGDRYIDYLLLDENKNPLAVVEAKKTSLSVEKGEIQSRTYQEDIEKQTRIKIPRFLTNGDKWYFIDEKDRKRKVVLPLSQKDLQRRASLREREKDPRKVKINSRIVDRERSIWAVKKILEHFAEGHRLALVNMATGTGKTRVAMAIIDGLIKSGYIQKALFITDRISLASNAKEEGFKDFIPGEPVCELNTEGFSDSARMYVTTVQTLMAGAKPRGKFYEKFGVGAFDLIIFDEAHRSYYDKNNDVMKYFDSLFLGLTATPSSEETRDTFKLFGCEYKRPTVEYSYDEAVEEGDLVPYVADVVETKVLSLGIEGAKLSKELKDALKKQEEDPEKAELLGSRFERYFTDTKTNELILSEFMDRCYKTPDEIPCKTIFFCASVKHAESLKSLFDKMYPTLAKTARVVTSDRTRYMDEVKRFKKNSDPRIVFSVGVLDTGVNIPEVCNLVFVKPVFSHIRFWQMLGRGTRNIKACKHKDWLPQKEGISVKEDFLILDFKFGDHSNVEYHQLDRTRAKSQLVNAKTKIFLEQVELLRKGLKGKDKEIVSKEILDTINSIDIDSPMVLGKKDIIKKVVSAKFDLDKHIEDLKNEIAPLLIYAKSENTKVYTFVLKCVKLFDAIKNEDKEKIGEVEEFVKEKLENVWEKGLEVIREKTEDIKKVLGDHFWGDLKFEDVDFLVREIAPLMIYYNKERKKMLIVDAPDYLIDVENVKMKIKENEDYSYFLNSNKLLRKIKDGEGVTSEELLDIEKQLSKLNPMWTIENIQRTKDFIIFLRELLEIKDLPDPQEMIKWEFDKLVSNKNEHYNSEQLKFLRYLRDVFVRAKHIELKDFAEHPLTEERPLDIFNTEQLKRITLKCNELRWK